jgi:hypothetical protein
MCEADRTATPVLYCAGKLPIRYWRYNRTEKVKTTGEYSTNDRGEKFTKKVWQEPEMEKTLELERTIILK